MKFPQGWGSHADDNLAIQPKALSLLHLNPIVGITEQKGSRATTTFPFLLLFVGARGLNSDHADPDYAWNDPLDGLWLCAAPNIVSLVTPQYIWLHIALVIHANDGHAFGWWKGQLWPFCCVLLFQGAELQTTASTREGCKNTEKSFQTWEI